MFNKQFMIPLLILGAASIPHAQQAFAQEGSAPKVLPTHYYYLGERTELELDGTRLLVRVVPGRFEEELVDHLAEVGVAIEGSERTAYDRIYHVFLAEPVSNARQANQRIESVLQSPAIEFASPIFHGQIENTWVAMTQNVLMKFRESHADLGESLLETMAPQLEILDPYFAGFHGGYQLHSEARNGFEVLAEANRLASSDHVEWAEPDAMFSGFSEFTPNDTSYGSLWAMNNTGQFGGTVGFDMDVDSAWNYTTGSAAVPVLVLDTGVQLGHPDLNTGLGADFSGGAAAGGNPVNACDNHGTAVAGCISAIINNNLGTVGISPACPTFSARCFISVVPCTGGWNTVISSTANALNWGFANGARVSNNSNFYGFSAGSIAAAYASTRSAGMVHFASAGNNFGGPITYPSSLSTVNSVAALQPNGLLSTFSNFGVGLAFSAPGQSIFTTDRTGAAGYVPGDYVTQAGTSFASPYTAAVAALILSLNPGMTAAQVEAQMIATSIDLGAPGYDTTFGNGMPNAHLAVTPVGLTPYGTGSPGCVGPQTHSANLAPKINTPGFTLNCNNAPPFSQGFVIAGSVPLLPGQVAFGALFHVPTGGSPPLFPVLSNGVGDAVLAGPIPNNPALIGVPLFTQFVWGWPSAICTPTVPFGLSTSNGLAIVFQC